jgi:methionyl-tRNA formyltransferase
MFIELLFARSAGLYNIGHRGYEQHENRLMRIVCVGQAAFGEKVLHKLTEGSEEVVAVYTPQDIAGKTNPLKELAIELGIPVFQSESMRAPEIYDRYERLKPDLNVMAYVTSILPDSILNYPKMGTIQYHPSLLPRHRGGSAINWAIIKGETRTGVTIFWPDEGVDTGPILLQKEVDISPEDTVGSLYFDKLFPLGVEALVEAVGLIKKGMAPRVPQVESLATYEGLCTEKDAAISWSAPIDRVYNLIRGTNPQPGAITCFRGTKLKVFDVKPVYDIVAGLPGQILETSADGFTVSLKQGAILVRRVQVKSSPKIGAAEFAREAGLRAGDRLGE